MTGSVGMDTEVELRGDFEGVFPCLFEKALAALAARLGDLRGLSAGERGIVLAATRESLNVVLHGKLSRLLLLELNAARVGGRLDGADSAQRWQQFQVMASQRAFWDELAAHYPTLHGRVGRIVANRCAAAADFARDWQAERSGLGVLCGAAPGELAALRFGAGDSHAGGRTVALLRCEGGRIVYKPRTVDVDIALRRFVAAIADAQDAPTSMRVPAAVGFGGHGWTEFVAHRYAADDEELGAFYRGIGHWLAVMRALGGSDLHAENLIAAGPHPVVVDCETLFTPRPAPPPSGRGQALDRAFALLRRTVLSVGLLPGRGQGLGWYGIDSSGVGMLSGQQPKLLQPRIVGSGSDAAHLGMEAVDMAMAQNHPSRKPELARFWPQVLDGFDEMTERLRRMDAAGELRPRLRDFAGCRVRVVPRATEAYAEIGRMLWHPVSLHEEEPARQRARELLARMAEHSAVAPHDPAVIEAEIEELLDGDVPCFDTLAGEGRLRGPRGTHWLPPQDLVEAALAQWRAADFELERSVIQGALISAYINDGWRPEERSLRPLRVRGDDLDLRRRREAAAIMQRLSASAIRGEDGSVAWIAPTIRPNGWSVQPLEQDLYGGLAGIAVLVAAYLREVRAGRADALPDLDGLLSAALHTLDLAAARQAAVERRGYKVRPRAPGGYIGLGSQIWSHLLLAAWGCDGGAGLQRARTLAAQMPAAAAADRSNDVLTGVAGAIPPLLALAGASGDAGYRAMAEDLGGLLGDRCRRRGETAFWVDENRWPEGLGGFAHGATGIGWALSKLADASGAARHRDLAAAAFAFEDALFDAQEANWLDLRGIEGIRSTAAWCHGAVGIGLAHADLDPALRQASARSRVGRAAAAAVRLGLGWNHCLCHGDLGTWELLDRAMAAGLGPRGLSREALLAEIVSGIEEHGPVCGSVRNVFMPGLMSGLGGIAYQLLRAHPDSDLPSVLTLGGLGV
jgi:type 2 lantibiotic biosynthesis protein LanM